MLELLARLRAGGTTVIVITHSPWVVAEYAERALLMRAGALVFDGAARNLARRRAAARARRRFEAPPAARVAHALGIRARTVDDAGARPRAGGRLRWPSRSISSRRAGCTAAIRSPRCWRLVMLFVAAFLLDHPALLAPFLCWSSLVTASAGALPVLYRMRWLMLPVFVFTTLIWTVFYPAPEGVAVDRLDGAPLRPRHGVPARDLPRDRLPLPRDHDHRGVRLRARAARRAVPRGLRADAGVPAGARLPRRGAHGPRRAALPRARLRARQRARAHRPLRAGDRPGVHRRAAARRPDGVRARGARVQLGPDADRVAATRLRRRPTFCCSLAAAALLAGTIALRVAGIGRLVAQ